jgi:hypothetical protein
MPNKVAVATAVLCATAFLPAPGHAAGCAAVRKQGPWTVVTMPAFPTPKDPSKGVPDGRLTLPYPLVAAGATAAEMYVTDGVSVLRTTDGGCTWGSVFELSALDAVNPDPGVAVSFATGRIEGLDTGTAPGTTRITATSVYVLVRSYENFSEGGPAVLVTSHDSGAHWRAATVAASCDGTAEPVVLGNSDDFVYASGPNAVNVNGFAPYPSNDNLRANSIVSADGGTTWTCPAFPGGGPAMRADPLDPRTLVTFACGGGRTPIRSTDGGAQWTALPALPLPPNHLCDGVDAVDVLHLPHSGVRLAAMVHTNPLYVPPPYWMVVDVSSDGRTWQYLGNVVRDPAGEEALGLALRYDGTPMVVLSVGAVPPSAPTGYAVRTWSSRKRVWLDGPSLGTLATGCAGGAIHTVTGVVPGDALRTSVLMRATVGNGCRPLLLRYRAG